MGLILIYLDLYAQPANDNCANATVLTNLENFCSNNENFAGATFDLADGACAPNYVNPPNTWYRFTAIHTEVVITAVNGSDRFKVTLVEFPAGQECNTPNFLACDLGGVNFSNLVVGNTYYIIISRDPIIPTFTLCIDNSVPAVPPNNNPCDAIVLSNGVQSCGNNNNATSTFDPSGMPCPTLSGADVWYRFTITAPNNTLTLSFSNVTLNGGNGQVLLGQWSNGCSGNYTYQTPVFCGSLGNNVVYSCLSPGTYYIMVSSQPNNAGEFCITATQSGPPQGCAGNDLCSNATQMSVPPIGNSTCSSGCNTGACGESNLNYQGCRLDLQATTWHTFTTGSQSNLLYNLTVTGGSHQISLFTGSCGSLNPIRLCQSSMDNIVLAPNTTYYVAVSTLYQNAGPYNFCIAVFENPSICNIGSSVEIVSTSFGSPPNGPYQQGEIVRVCLRVDNWDASQNNCQWIHGIVPMFGNGWDQTSFDGAGQPDINRTGPDPRHMNEGYWDWFTGVVYNTVVNPATATRRVYVDQFGNIRICHIFQPDCNPAYPILTAGSTLPGGWFVCRQAASQGPCPLNWGDGNNCGPGHGPWEVCFDLKAKEFDEDVICEDLTPEEVDCSIVFFTMADGETGSWSAFDCAGDLPAIHNATVNCCTRPRGEEDSDLICSGGTTSITLRANQNPIKFEWTVSMPPGVVGGSAGTGAGIFQTLFNNTSTTQRVTYTVTPINEATECIGRPFEVYVDVLPRIVLVMETDPVDKRGCASTPFQITANPSGGSGGGYTYLWSSGDPNTAQTIEVLPGSPGRYTYFVTVTDDNGCTSTGQETVEIFPKITAELQIEETEFCEEFAPKTLSVVTGPSTIVARYNWVNPGPPTPPNRSFINVRLSGYYAVTITDTNGCTGDDEITIQVNPTPVIYTLTAPPDTVCVDLDVDDEDYIDFSLIWLDFSQDQTFAIWEGSAEPVLNGRVYPKALYDAYGPGTYDIKLTLESIHGCIDSISHEFEIIGPPELNLQPQNPLCATAAPVILQATPIGGRWLGPGIVNQQVFDPVLAGPGTHTVYYELTQSDCRAIDSMQIIVNPPPLVVLDSVGPFCFGDPFVQLTASRPGGSWVGLGVTDPSGIFEPVVSGAGLHRVEYVYQEGTCTFRYDMNILVHPEIVSSFTIDPLVCLTDASVTQFTGVAPQGTRFIWQIDDGQILQNDDRGQIEIEWQSSGAKQVSLSLEIDGCLDGPFTRLVEVEQPLETPLLVCDSASTTSVHFTWGAVTNAIGYEVTYGARVDTVSDHRYSVTDIMPGAVVDVTITVVALGNGICGNSAPATLTCTSLPCPNILLNPLNDNMNLCIYNTTDRTQLEVEVINSDGSGVGVWAGIGVTPDGRFNPSIAGVGAHLLTFTFTEQSCPYNVNVLINTHNPPIARWIADEYLVCQDQIVHIDFNGVLPRTSTAIWEFDGATVISGSGFGPYQLRWDTPGIKQVTLRAVDAVCESAPFVGSIEVEAPLEIPNISCESNPISVRFFWDPVPNATGYRYEYRINGGVLVPNFTLDTFLLVTGLNQGDQVSITIYATGSGVCGDSDPITFVCEAKECPRISVNVEPVAPICLDANAQPVALEVVITGSDQSGIGVWSGPGINQQGIFDPRIAGVGNHQIDYRFTEDFCNYFANTVIRVIEVPVASIVAGGPICIGEEIELRGAGAIGSNAVFNWVVSGGGSIVDGQGTDRVRVNWSVAGTKDITLVITENGCNSEPAAARVIVESPLTAPVITCESAPTEILFTWAEVSGAIGYEVRINGGQAFVTTDRQSFIDGLTVGQRVTISVIPIGTGPCGNGPEVVLECEAEPCPNIDVAIRPVSLICLDSGTDNINLRVDVTGEVNQGTGFWSGIGILGADDGLFSPSQAGVGNHWVYYTFREKGCNYVDSLLIDIRPQPLALFDADSPICLGQEIRLNFTGSATGLAVFNWNLDGATILSGAGSATPIIRWNSPGTKRLTLQIQDNGCNTAPVTREVVVEQPLAAPVIRCQSTLTSVAFTWDPIPGNQGYLISINGGAPFVIQQTSFQLSNMQTGDSVTIVVIALNDGPCGNSSPDQLTCFAADCRDVLLTIDPVEPVCLYSPADNITLRARATNGYGDGTFTWSGVGVSGNQFDPNVAGLGTHEIQLLYREFVCPYRSSLLIEVVDIPLMDIDYWSPLCYGVHDGKIEVIDVIGGLPPYTFALGQGTPGSSSMFLNLRPGSHTIQVIDQNNCRSRQTVILEQPERLVVDLGPDRIEEAGEPFEIIPSFNVPVQEIVDYYWHGFDQLNCPTCPEIELTLYEQTRIYLKVTDERGCVASDDINIQVRKKRRVFIPNSFTPDDDGTNDRLVIYGGEEVEEIEAFYIFDRWGEKLFFNENFPPNSEPDGWDGTFNNRKLNPGVFVFHVKVRFRDGTKEDYFGDVTLLKN